jgi:hypothetical protein
MSVSKFNPVNIFGRDGSFSEGESEIYYFQNCSTWNSGTWLTCCGYDGFWGTCNCWTEWKTYTCTPASGTRYWNNTGTLAHYWTYVGFRISGGVINVTFGYYKNKSASNSGGYGTTSSWTNTLANANLLLNPNLVENTIMCYVNGTTVATINPSTAAGTSGSVTITDSINNADTRTGRVVFTSSFTSLSQITSVSMSLSSGETVTSNGQSATFFTPSGGTSVVYNAPCSLPETIQLDVTAISPGLTVVKTCPYYGRALLLPSASSANGKQFIIKNLVATTSNYSSANINAHAYGYTKSIIICTTDNSNIDDDQTSFTMTRQYQCVVLTSDGSNWWIIGNYIADLSTAAQTATRTLTATVGINVVHTSSSGRSSGDVNRVNLPAPATTNLGRMLIIAVGGSFNNKTYITVSGGSNIDNYTAGYTLQAGTAGYPTGAIFVCDGTNWHLVGYFNTTNVVFDNAVLISGGTAKVSSNYVAGSDNHLCRTYVSGTQTLTGDWQSVIFPTALPRAERSYCCIYKSRNSTYGNASYVLHPLVGGAAGSSTTNTLNYPNGYARMWMNGVRARYTVYWVVGIIDGSYIRWFTVMNRNDTDGPGGSNPSASPAGVTPITPS